jgi:hypothetical protein
MGLALVDAPGSGSGPAPQVLQLVEPALEVLDPLDERAGEHGPPLVEQAGPD